MASEPGSQGGSLTWIRSETGERPTVEPGPAVEAFVDPSARYAGGDVLGEGGMGEVTVQHDRWLGRDVARKRLRSDRTSEESVQRFVLEARVMGRLQHPNIVPVYDMGSDDDGPWFVMRRIDGESLQTLLLERRLGTLVRRLEIFLKVCDALGYAHSRGVVHRDVKPGNVMVGAHGEVLLLDWGCARVRGTPDLPPDPDAPTSGSGLTREDAVLGTPGYMAPEQALGQVDQIDERTDVYALGALLYALLTDSPPYPKEVRDVLERVKAGVLDPPRSRKADVPWELEAVVLRAMAHRPQDRFPTVEELQRAVVGFQEGRELPFVRYGFAHRTAKFARRHRRVLAASGVAGFGLALALAFAVSLYSVGLRSSLDQVRAAERRSSARLAREQVALALLEGRDGRFVDARERLESARQLLVRLGESQIPVDAADAWLADLAPPPTLALHVASTSEPQFALSDDGQQLLVARPPVDALGVRVALTSVADGAVRARVSRPPVDGAEPAGTWFWRGSPAVAWSVSGALELRSLDGALLATIPGSSGRTFVAGDRWIATVDGGTRVYALPGGDPVATVPGTLVDVNASGTRVITAIGATGSMSSPEQVAVWDATDGEELWRGPFTFAVAVSPDGDTAAFVDNGVLSLIDLPSRRERARATASVGDRPRFSLDGRTLVLLDEHRVEFLDPATGATLYRQPAAGAVLRSSGQFAVDGPGDHLASVANGEITVWTRPDGPVGSRVATGDEHLRTVAVSPDGLLVAAAGGSGVLYVVDRISGVRLLTSPTSAAGTRDVDFSPDGSAVFTADRDGAVRRYELGGDGTPAVAPLGCGITSAVVALAADRVIAACAGGRVLEWQFGVGEQWAVDPGLGALWDARATPDGRSVLLTSRDGLHPLGALLDLRTHETTLLDPEHRVSYRASISADGQWYAVADHQGQPRVFSAHPPYPARTLRITPEVVLAVALSADGSVLAAGDYSGTAHLWDVARGESLGAFDLHGVQVTDLEWAPGTRALISVGGDSRIRQLDLDAGARAASVGGSRDLGAEPDAEPTRRIELARLAEARGSWADALGLYRAAADAGAPVRHVDQARALAALGRRSEADAELALAAGEASPGTVAALRRSLVVP